MADKKLTTHDEYHAAISAANAALESLKSEYKVFLKDNPLSLPKQPTPHELRMMRERLGEKQDAAHDHVNAAQAQAVKSKQLNRKIEGKSK